PKPNERRSATAATTHRVQPRSRFRIGIRCSAWLLNISNRRHKNRAENYQDDSELEQHRQQREKHPANLAANCLAARPYYQLANEQSNHRNDKKQRPDKHARQVNLQIVGKNQQEKTSGRTEEG